MSGDELEAAGNLAEGALVARAVEPARGSAGQVRNGHFAGNECRNCGETLTGNYCSGCGQKAHLHRTLGAFWHDLIHGALHFDGKMWRTLPMLVFKPGELTRRYIDGERARYVSPMALFLFALFLMFAVFSAIGLTTPVDIRTGDQVERGMEQVGSIIDNNVETLEERLADLPADDPERAEIEADIADLTHARDRIESEVVPSDASDGGDITLTGFKAIDSGLIEKWRSNPGLMLYKLQANSYKFGWLLIPLSIPFVWLLFAWKRRFNTYDHAIFVTYSLSFMSLLFILLTVLGKAGIASQTLVLAGLALPLAHIYRQMRATYRLRRRSAIWRTIMLTVMILIVLSLFVYLLLLLGAM